MEQVKEISEPEYKKFKRGLHKNSQRHVIGQ